MSNKLVNTLGGTQIKAGGCCLEIGVISEPGSDDSVINFYDGTDTTGELIATLSMGIEGRLGMPVSCCKDGLFVNVTGTSPGVCMVQYQ